MPVVEGCNLVCRKDVKEGDVDNQQILVENAAMKPNT